MAEQTQIQRRDRSRDDERQTTRKVAQRCGCGAGSSSLSTKEEELQAAQRRAEGGPGAKGVAQLAARVHGEGGMPGNLQAGLEQLSGMDLSDVRVRYNSPKPAQLAAHAYTQGSEIHVAPGQEQHLPHEGWHVVQQKQGRVRPTMELSGTAINDDPGLEREADVMGARAAGAVQRAAAESANTLPPVQRREKPAGARVVLDTPTGDGIDGAQVVQKANIRWTSEPPPRVADIDFGPRSGSQEDHTTAFTTFQLAVLQNLHGQTVKGAVIQLYILANEITELPAFGDYRNRYLANEVGRLKATLMTLIDQADGNPLYVAGELGSAIDDYLRIRNLVPGTHFPSSDVTRPPDYKGGGKAEKEGKAELLQVMDELGKGSEVSEVEGLIKSALGKLHDYITSRKSLPTMDELAKITGQHFDSIMQVDPRLYPYAEEILGVWMNQVFDQWQKVIPMDWGSFTRAVIGYAQPYVDPVGGKRETDFGTTTKSEIREIDSSFVLESSQTPTGAQVVDSNEIPTWQRIQLINRMAEERLVWAVNLIQYVIENPDQQNHVLDNLGVRFVILPNGKVRVQLKGG